MTTAVKERAILFSAPMVRAILDGRKTVTRRVVKTQPGWAGRVESLGSTWIAYQDDFGRSIGRCPYGQPGDILWVRENGWQPPEITPRMEREGADTWPAWAYSADYAESKEWYKENGWTFRPSIHMPRWVCRLFLEVEAVRVERLHEITSEQAFAEGFEDHVRGHVWQFRELWHKLNGPESWNANPWVWVVQFRRVEL